jgi:uncharacterized membrane protein
MNALEFLGGHWLAVTLLVLGLVGLVAVAARRQRLGGGFLAWALACGAVALPGLGALLPPAGPWGGWGAWLAGGAALVLFVMAGLLLATGVWNNWAALAVAALGLFGLGALAVNPAGAWISDTADAVAGTEFVHPLWMLLLLLVPVVFALSWRSLYRFESARPWVSAVLRSAGVVLLALALAQPRVRETGEHVAVLFVLDRSESVPDETDENGVHVRSERIKRFINDAVEERGAGHERDKAGLIVFGRRPRLEYPPSDASRHWLHDLPAASDGSYTDIGAALKMALASFPEGSSKRIVLLSDGNENRGNAEEQANLAKTLGVQIDVVMLGAGRRNEDEVLVERVEAPTRIEKGSKTPIRVLVRSYNPNVVVGQLTLKQLSGGKAEDVTPPGGVQVELRRGLNPFTFTRQLAEEDKSYTYEAQFRPLWVEDENGKVLHPDLELDANGKPKKDKNGELVKKKPGEPVLPGDRVENNRAATHIVAHGQRKILLLEDKAGTHEELAKSLEQAGKKFEVERFPVEKVLSLFEDEGQLKNFLTEYDCVILADVASDQVSAAHQEALRKNTHDLGCGLIMVGGPQGFGAGGWQDTPVEKALPVDCDIKSLMVQGRGGLVLIMHGCEMGDGNLWEKRTAKLAIQRLGPSDFIGVIDGQQRWHIPFQEIGDKKDKLLAQVESLVPGDMMDFDRPLGMAYKALADEKEKLTVKHIIIMSDGDPVLSDIGLPPAQQTLLPKLKAAKITVSTVAFAAHGPNEDAKMKTIADVTGGTAHSVRNSNQLPAIYIKETRLVAQSFVDLTHNSPEIQFRTGPTEGDTLPQRLEEIKGYVRTTPKESPLVEVNIVTPDTKAFAGQRFPILAHWQYGLGKAVAFTSDAGKPEFWTADWGKEGVFTKFWQKVVDWSLRPTENKNVVMTAEVRDGKIHIVIEANTQEGKKDVNLKLNAGLSAPGGAPGEAGQKPLRFIQTNSGRYEATVAAEDAGSYFVYAEGVQMGKDENGKPKPIPFSVRGGVTLPYSPEFAEQETNETLLRRLAEITGGKVYKDTDEELTAAARTSELFRFSATQDKSKQPVWQWLLFLAGLLLFIDVAVRRLSVDWNKTRTAVQRSWMRLRGIPVPPDQPEYGDKLGTRRPAASAVAAAAETAALRSRAARRFEATGEYGEAPPIAGAAPPPAAAGGRPAARGPGGVGGPEAEPGAPAGDYADRLFKAKKRALGGEQDKDKDKPT